MLSENEKFSITESTNRSQICDRAHDVCMRILTLVSNDNYDNDEQEENK